MIIEQKYINNFWEKVSINDSTDCWEWIGSCDQDGYGNFWYKLPNNKKQKSAKAHRFSMMISGHIIPKGHFVLHACDNPGCVNPAHLSIGTHKDNMIDRNNKGRQTKGETHPKAILTKNQVLEIRKKCSIIKHKNLALEYGVSVWTIRDISNRSTWKHI